jgi:hypothetical protein
VAPPTPLPHEAIRARLQQGLVIPAHPLALNAARRLDERHQRALTRYYIAAGAGGVAVGVHTTQFAIRDPKVGLLEPVLELAAEEMCRPDNAEVIRIAGVCGSTAQALSEAQLAQRLGYHAGLLSLAALADADEDALIAHCTAVSDTLPIIGFYLQPAVGGRVLSYRFWRRFAEIDQVLAIKIAPFNRYQTLDVVRAVVDAGRTDIALYTGNDDAIVTDLITPFTFPTPDGPATRHIVGGLLGHWSVWTRKAVELLNECHTAQENRVAPGALLQRAVEVTDCNAAFFDAANQFQGCIAGLHEVLRRQGLLKGIWCLDPNEGLSPGQLEQIDRVLRSYPQLNDDVFVSSHLDTWLS